MTSGTDEGQRPLGFVPGQKPVRLDVTFPEPVPFARQSVPSAAGRQGLPSNEQIHDLPELVERLATPLCLPQIPLELLGGPPRASTMRYLELLEVGPLRQVLTEEGDWTRVSAYKPGTKHLVDGWVATRFLVDTPTIAASPHRHQPSVPRDDGLQITDAHWFAAPLALFAEFH